MLVNSVQTDPLAVETQARHRANVQIRGDDILRAADDLDRITQLHVLRECSMNGGAWAWPALSHRLYSKKQ